MRSAWIAPWVAAALACSSGGGGAGQGDPCGVAGGACPAGEQCCEAGVFGLASDTCVARDRACPIGCPGGADACALGTLCQPDPEAGGYACVSSCEEGRLCGFNVCCPLGGSCAGGACRLPDLEIGEEHLAGSLRVELDEFEAGACELTEGCVGGAGHRLLLRFDLVTFNRGEGDLLLGSPVENPLFHFSECHLHHHFDGFAAFQLLDEAGAVVASSTKYGFCLRDAGRADGGAAEDPRFSCDYQGLQAGWGDIYPAWLPCQWIDVTEVAAGDYALEVVLNPERAIAESDYRDNRVAMPVTIPVNSCPGGCRRPEAACCAPGDPCGRAGDGVCDCGGVYSWDAADCGSCRGIDAWCDPPTTCPGGCQPEGPGCVATPEDGVCDCGGAGDESDCAACLSEDPDCPAYTSCPGGCTPYDPDDPCCASESSDSCGLAEDGICQCGAQPWDAVDCAYCPTPC